MIALNQLIYQYQDTRFSFDFEVKQGEMVAILGPSGAGKSTLLNLIAGFISSESGSLVLNHQEMTREDPKFRPISMLFQENNLLMHLTVERNIALGITSALKLTKSHKQQVLKIAKEMGLDTLLERLPSTLSGGQRQRVALARCLVQKRPILLLDEPFSSLDPALRQDMLSLVKNYCERDNITLLMVSHHLDDARFITPRSIVIDDGHVIYDGKTSVLMSVDSLAAQKLGLLN